MTELLDFTRPHVLRDEAEYDKAVEEIDWLLDADPPKGSAEYERLEFLSVLVEEYEERHFPMGEDVSPQEAVDFMLEQKGLERSDLAEWLGGRSRVSEFFSGKRPLSKSQIEALREHLGISADLLLT
ncbi:MAG TPA: helix-turn-helix domain-containing protein [Longimicrobiales bacterium]|nr:helix-turn-helix domain-containing protein [Longimicrobiales bacterium]